MKTFVLQWLSFNFILIALSIFLQQRYAPQIIFVEHYWFLFGFLSILTLVGFVIVHYANIKSSETGIQGMMLAIGIKLILTMILILVIAKKMHPNKVLFMTNFFSLYFLFSLFEIRAMLRNLRHQNLRKKS